MLAILSCILLKRGWFVLLNTSSQRVHPVSGYVPGRVVQIRLVFNDAIFCIETLDLSSVMCANALKLVVMR